MKQTLALLLIVCLVACTESNGDYYTSTITLQPNEKLISVTYAASEVWCLTRPMNNADTATIYEFKKPKSAYPYKYTIIETKTIPDLPIMKVNRVVVPYKNMQDYLPPIGNDTGHIIRHRKAIQIMNGKGDNIGGNKIVTH